MKNAKLKIVVASGKGGVGKSMLASGLTMLFARDRKVVAVDCDVDAPNLHLWLASSSEALAKEGRKEDFAYVKTSADMWDKVEKISTNERPVIDYQKCNLCGKCVEICAFKALRLAPLAQGKLTENKLTINPFFCEGCGACEVVCPQKAIKMEKVYNAEIRTKRIRGFPLISAQLYPGETGSGKIVEEIKSRAEKFDYDLMVLDSPAGIGCPVIAALKDANFAVLITEPTPSGLSDLKRVLTLVDYFKIPFGVVINKWDIYPELSRRIETEFEEQILGKISYDKKIFKAIANLIPIMETDLPAKEEIEKIFVRLEREINFANTGLL